MGGVFKISWRQAVVARTRDVFAEENLFKPLGVAEVEWSFIQPDIVQASGGRVRGGYYTYRESVNEIVTEFILPALAQGS